MANEVSTLNIGNVEYPIYGEGVRLEQFNNIKRYGSYNIVMGNGIPSYSKLAISPIGFQANDDNTIGLTIPAISYTNINSQSTNINSQSTNIIGNLVQIEANNVNTDQYIYQSGAINAEPDIVELSNTFDDGTNNKLAKLSLSDTYAHLRVEDNIPEDGTHSWASIDMDSTRDSRIAINGKYVFINDNDATDLYEEEENDFNYVGIGNNVYKTPEYEGHEPRHSDIEIGSNAFSINVGSNAKNITIGNNSEFAAFFSIGNTVISGNYTVINGSNNTVLIGDTNKIQLGNYSRIIGVGTSEDVQGICMTTGGRSTGDWNSVDIYGTTFSIRQVHNCDTSDEYEHSIIMDEDGLRMQAEYYNGESLGQINIDASGDTFQIYSGTTLNIEGPEISIGATGGSSNIVIGKTYNSAGISTCEILNSRIFLCKPNRSTDSTTGFVFEGGGTTSSSISSFRPYRVTGSGTANLGANINLQKWTNVYSINGVNNSSDERLKNIVDNIDVNLDDLVELRKFKYTWKNIDDDRVYVGMSAQEVQKLYPDIVETGEDGYLSMSYERLSVIALAAIDKLHEENKQLKDRLTRLENIVNE